MVNQARFPHESRPIRRPNRPEEPHITVGVWERIKEVLRNDWEQTKEDFGIAGPPEKSDRPSRSRSNT